MPLKDTRERKKYHDAYSKIWYQKRKEIHKKQQYSARNVRRKKNKDYVDKLKSNSCTDCGKKYPPYVMHFDHLPKYKKIIEIGQMRCWGIEKIKTEIEKCELVCANCHAERTHKRRNKHL